MIAQHMARDEHAELVLGLLNREGRWPATIPADNTPLEGGRLYLLPAEQDGIVTEGAIRLEAPAADSYSSPSVNRLFRSLADQYGVRTLALILSGAGSDGAYGCRAVKQKGGEVWIQSPDEAAYDSMPQSASDAVNADFMGTVAEIADGLQVRIRPNIPVRAQSLKPISSRPLQTDSAPLNPTQNVMSPEPIDTELAQITALIHEYTGISFAGYKQETLLRRLDKRKSQIAAELGESTARHYLDYLQHHRRELEVLEQYLLVSVSSFYRDADVYRSLAQALVPLMQNKREQIAPGNEPSVFRILVAGCATGEEAYSLAILCRQLEEAIPVEIIAIDLNRDAIRSAEKGVYPAKKLAEMPPELIRRYFEVSGDNVTVKRIIRDQVQFIQGDIFAQHFDKPFDFVSCRNLMIYLKREQQDQLISQFHQQMQPVSGLVVGLTESLSLMGQKLFTTTDYYHRIYRRR